MLNDTIKATITEAKAERDKLDALINSLEGIAGPIAVAIAKGPVTRTTKRKGWSEAAKKAASKRMKAYWSARAKEG